MLLLVVSMTFYCWCWWGHNHTAYFLSYLLVHYGYTRAQWASDWGSAQPWWLESQHFPPKSLNLRCLKISPFGHSLAFCVATLAHLSSWLVDGNLSYTGIMTYNTTLCRSGRWPCAFSGFLYQWSTGVRLSLVNIPLPPAGKRAFFRNETILFNTVSLNNIMKAYFLLDYLSTIVTTASNALLSPSLNIVV